MITGLKRWLLPGLILMALPGIGLRADAQGLYAPRYIEPQWFTFRLSELSAGVYAEGTHQESSYRNSNTSVTYDRYFVGPALGLAADGSIYHPNLLRYSINAEGAVGWAHDSFSGSGNFDSRDEFDYLGHFNANLDLLPSKPYRGNAFVSYDHSYRDADFFSRIWVESLRYGGRLAWDTGPWVFNASYLHRDETSTSPFPYETVVTTTSVVNGTNVVNTTTNQVTRDQQTISHEDTATFSARNARDHGGSSLTYNLDHYTRSDFGTVGTGTDHTIAAGDSERFGAHDQFHLNNDVSYSRRDTSFEKSDEVLTTSTLNIEHTPNLRSFYDFSFDYYDTTDFNSENYAGSASLQHQLYESLTSTLTVRGVDTETADPVFSGYSRRYGGGFTESYTKRLSPGARLRVANSLFLDHTDQETLGVVKNERHQILPAGENGAPPNSFFLNQPQVLVFTIVITDTAQTFQFIPDFDYRVLQLGSRTQIEWLSPPGRPAPPAVLVSYRTEPTPPGQYETLTENFMVRFELWRNLIGIYGRGNLSLNNAPFELHISDYTTYAAGMDLTWRNLRAGAEYEIYDSTDSEYHAARFFQSYSLHPDESSTLSFDLSQMLIDYDTVGRQEQDYRFITQYRLALTHRLSVEAAAGVDFRRGEGVDQTLATVRPAVLYNIGKTRINAGYDYEYQLFLNNEERQKHMFFLSVRRAF